jgi:methylthioribulose-1-phosphate dehydratase
LSAVLEREPLRLLVTASGKPKGRLQADDFLVVDAQGQPEPRAQGRPSAETLLHVAVVQRAGAAAVLHTHSVAGTLLGEHFRPKGGLTIAGYEMLKGLEGIASHEASTFLPVLANSQDMHVLGEDVRRLFDEYPSLHGFLIAGHGLYTWGESVEQAQRHVEILEFLLEVLLLRTPLEPYVG